MSLFRIGSALLVAVTILYGIHYFIWVRLGRDPAISPAWSRAIAAALAVLCACVVLGFVAHRLPRFPRVLVASVSWVGFTWLGVAFLLIVGLAFGDLVRLFVGIAARMLSDTVPDVDRRRALARILAGAAGTFAVVMAGAGLRGALGRPAIKTVKIALRRWPAHLSGYTIVQLSDIHVGPTIGREFIESIVATVNALSPDLVVITGDLVDGSVAELGRSVSPLADLRARDGVFFVLGNHEYYSGAKEWIRHLPTLGIRVLVNERVSVAGLAGFDLAGVDDPTGAPDMARTLADRDSDRAVVLLAHQPRAVFDASKLGVDLQLSGHTHGGQIFPFHVLVGLQQPYVSGLHDHHGTAVYVSRGTGYWGPAMRIGAPAEITRIELRRS